MKLISMTDFVLEQDKLPFDEKGDWDIFCICRLDNITNYANFLKQPLELWMFVPCDEEGIILKHPDELKGTYSNSNAAAKYRQRWNEAKGRVLFEGFEIGHYSDGPHSIEFEDLVLNFSSLNEFIVEDITGHPELTPTALKQIGL